MDLKTEHINQVQDVLKAVKEKAATKFYFVACGGSMATLQSFQYIFDRETSVPSFIYNAEEFVNRNPKGLDERSIVVLCSHSGKTKETARAAKFSREKGALTFGFSNSRDSLLSRELEYLVHYDYGDNIDYEQGMSAQILKVIFGILDILEEDDKYSRGVEAIKSIDYNIKSTLDRFDEKALTFAKNYKREEIIYTVGSGMCYPEAYATAGCFFMEMQWMHSNGIHSNELFHGPFEVADYDVPFMLIISTGVSRIMDERAYDFLSKTTDKLVVIDTHDFVMNDIDDDLLDYFAQPILTEVVKRYIERLADARGHLMQVRRYMGKIEY